MPIRIPDNLPARKILEDAGFAVEVVAAKE